MNKYGVNVNEAGVTIGWEKGCFPAFINHCFSDESFFGEIICSKNLLHISSMYEIKCLGEIYA